MDTAHTRPHRLWHFWHAYEGTLYAQSLVPTSKTATRMSSLNRFRGQPTSSNHRAPAHLTRSYRYAYGETHRPHSHKPPPIALQFPLQYWTYLQSFLPLRTKWRPDAHAIAGLGAVRMRNQDQGGIRRVRCSNV